jgi:hypothetical protein
LGSIPASALSFTAALITIGATVVALAVVVVPISVVQLLICQDGVVVFFPSDWIAPAISLPPPSKRFRGSLVRTIVRNVPVLVYHGLWCTTLGCATPGLRRV